MGYSIREEKPPQENSSRHPRRSLLPFLAEYPSAQTSGKLDEDGHRAVLEKERLPEKDKLNNLTSTGAHTGLGDVLISHSEETSLSIQRPEKGHTTGVGLNEPYSKCCFRFIQSLKTSLEMIKLIST